jgi:PPOX class probable F420-dependent enzyme
MGQPVQSTPFDLVRDHQYINLITFRKNGQSVTTPVWFAQQGERLYVMTVDGSGKVKRIRNCARVEVGPSDRAGKPLGPTVLASARILPASENARADDLLNQKYGIQKRAFDAMMKLRGVERVYLEIVPADENLGHSAT